MEDDMCLDESEKRASRNELVSRLCKRLWHLGV